MATVECVSPPPSLPRTLQGATSPRLTLNPLSSSSRSPELELQVVAAPRAALPVEVTLDGGDDDDDHHHHHHEQHLRGSSLLANGRAIVLAAVRQDGRSL